jgi:hypothetical protein
VLTVIKLILSLMTTQQGARRCELYARTPSLRTMKVLCHNGSKFSRINAENLTSGTRMRSSVTTVFGSLTAESVQD